MRIVNCQRVLDANGGVYCVFAQYAGVIPEVRCSDPPTNRLPIDQPEVRDSEVEIDLDQLMRCGLLQGHTQIFGSEAQAVVAIERLGFSVTRLPDVWRTAQPKQEVKTGEN